MRGKVRYIAASVWLFWDHPRVCGEKVYHVYTEDELPGSPPRMRGKGPVLIFEVGVQGITPAYAGKRPGDQSRPGDHRDHPRVCGEKQ